MWSNTSPVRTLFEVDSGCALVSIRTLSTRSMDCCEVSQRGQASSGSRANQSGLPLLICSVPNWECLCPSNLGRLAAKLPTDTMSVGIGVAVY